MNPQDSVAIVTGGAQNIGAGIAHSLVAKGCKVVVLDIAPLPPEMIAAGSLTGLVCDVSNPSEVALALDKVLELHGRLDVVVNAAGWIYSCPVFNPLDRSNSRHGHDSWEKVLQANLTTTFVMGSHAIERMARTRTRGLIVNISSVASAGNAGQSAYSAAKAGINALTITWAKELGAMGIRCIAISPGFIDTPTTRDAMNQERLNAWIAKVPLRRLGEIDHISKTVLFAVENDYVNGTVLEVDGGLSL